MGAFLQVVVGVFLSGAFAFSLMSVFKPSKEEQEKVRKFSERNAMYGNYSAVLQAVSQPGSKPIYRQKPGEQHPIPELAEKGKK